MGDHAAVQPGEHGPLNRLSIFAPEAVTFAVDHAARLRTLNDGVCPNGTQTTGPSVGADLQVGISSDPPGLAVGRLSDGFFWDATPESLALALPNLLQLGHPAVPDGQAITYSIKYTNSGTEPAVGVSVQLRAHGALRLLDQQLNLGDIPAGAEGVGTFRGVVDRSLSDLNLAVVGARLYDAAHTTDGPPLDWMVAGHRVDEGAPLASALGFNLLARSVGPNSTLLLSGRSHDTSGVAGVKVRVLSSSGDSTVIDCPVEKPADGGWRCRWDVAAAAGFTPADGDEFTLSLQATDRFGYTSDWVGADRRAGRRPRTRTGPGQAGEPYPARQGNPRPEDAPHRQRARRQRARVRSGLRGGTMRVCQSNRQGSLVIPAAGPGAPRLPAAHHHRPRR